MSKGHNYLKDEGHVSKTGRTFIKLTKSGKKYYYNPNTYQDRKKRLNEQRIKEGLPIVGCDIQTRSNPYCHDKTSLSYMRYWNKKCEIRNEYPKWVHMNREECREYYQRIWNLMHHDEDYLQWKEESKTMDEKMKDLWWEEKNEKDRNYDGHNDEYDWKSV